MKYFVLGEIGIVSIIAIIGMTRLVHQSKDDTPLFYCALSLKKLVYSELDNDFGELILTNVSGKPITITYRTHPWQFLDFRFTNRDNKQVTTFNYGVIFSPFADDQTTSVPPGGNLNGAISFASVFDLKKLSPGKYSVSVSYTIDSARSTSEEYEITIVRSNTN